MLLLLQNSLLSPQWITLGLAVVLIYWLVQKRQYPPGPQGFPMVNNLFDIPSSLEHVVYTEWGRKYGDVAYASALGRHIVVLNSVKAATELLDQRSAIYSDRPSLAMMDLMGAGFNFGTMHYSRKWKFYRRIFSQHIHPTSLTPSFSKKQAISTNRMLKLLLQNSNKLREHLAYCSASIILDIAYGYEVQATHDPVVELADKAIQMNGDGFQAKWLPNIFPAARHIPGWFPGNKFASFAKKAAGLLHQLQEIAFDDCLKKIRLGECPPCFVQLALEETKDPGSDPMLYKAVKEISAVMYEAGVDTVTSAAQSLIIQLILHPEIQQCAHAELDSVIGSPYSPDFRFPRIEDRTALPYLEALCQEVLRFRPPVSQGVPHAVIEDDIYRGWKIPKGSVVIANSWGIGRDESVYSDPEKFNPNRFLDTPDKPAEPYFPFSFGFGRRICPGRGLGEQSLWIQIACLLAAFQFTPAKDEKGNEINIEYAAGPRSGFIHDPGHFPCTVQSRSKIVEKAIHELETAQA